MVFTGVAKKAMPSRQTTEGGVVLVGEHRGIRAHVVVDREGRVTTAYPLPGQEEQGVRVNPEDEDQ
jgi:hypothetical protein